MWRDVLAVLLYAVIVGGFALALVYPLIVRWRERTADHLDAIDRIEARYRDE